MLVVVAAVAASVLANDVLAPSRCHFVRLVVGGSRPCLAICSLFHCSVAVRQFLLQILEHPSFWKSKITHSNDN